MRQAVAVSHYNVIALIVQIATYNRISEDYAPWEDRRFRPGDINAGGERLIPGHLIGSMLTTSCIQLRLSLVGA